MKKLTPIQQLEKRMKDANTELQKISIERTPDKKNYATYARVGIELGMSGQSVGNYVNKKGSNGFLVEALIEEFKKLPVVK